MTEDDVDVVDLYMYMQGLALYPEYAHTFAIKFYYRDGIGHMNINPVCKDGYRFALHVSKKIIANDNLA